MSSPDKSEVEYRPGDDDASSDDCETSESSSDFSDTDHNSAQPVSYYQPVGKNCSVV